MIDLPGLTFDHGEDIAALREAIQQFAAAEIAPRAAEIDRNDQFPMDLVYPAVQTIVGQSNSPTRQMLSDTPQAKRFLSKSTTLMTQIGAAQGG